MRKSFLVILFFVLLGLVASAIMTQMHARLEREGFQEKSFCNVSEFVDCDTALASRYAKIGGVPTSQLGLLYYLFFFFATLTAWFSANSRRATLSFLLTASGLALLYSVAYAYLSIFRLGVLCLLCLTTYLANLFLVLLIPRGLGIKISQIPAHLWGYARSIGGRSEYPARLGAHLIAFGLFLGVGLLLFQTGRAEDPIQKIEVSDEFYLKMFYSTSPKELTLSGPHSWGGAESPVTIVEFSDFQCPFCRRAAFSLKPYLGELKKKVRFVFINYPLDNACNPQVTHAMHPVACLAAKASLCAGERGEFWKYHDLAFENQKKLSRSTLVALAKRLGIEEKWFSSCLVAPETEAQLAREIEEGVRFEVRGTPAVYINGRPFRDWNDPARLRLIVEAELKATKS